VGPVVPIQPPARIARILVVDDEPKLAQLLQAFLELQGHQVWTTTEGAAAVTLLAERTFDLLLTDLGMPEMSGWDVAREARRIRPDLPVLMVSGWGAEIDPQQVAESGVAEVIQKPYTFETIHQVIDKVLRQSAPREKPEYANGQRIEQSSPSRVFTLGRRRNRPQFLLDTAPSPGANQPDDCFLPSPTGIVRDRDHVNVSVFALPNEVDPQELGAQIVFETVARTIVDHARRL
jgi:CheY-like chemotaxis protein